MPVTPEDELAYWDTKLTELRRGQLETVQKAATAWSALFAGILGLFGTVAFAGGLTSIDKLPDPWDLVATAITILAAGTALVATIEAARAAQHLSAEEVAGLTPKGLRARNHAAAITSLQRLTSAKRWGAVAAGAVLVGSTMILVVGEAEKETKPPAVVAVIGGAAVCGELETSAGELTVADTPLSGEVESLTLVDACPEIPDDAPD